MITDKDQFKHGNISSIVYFNLERFNYPTDNRLVESITEYLYNRIDSMNDFNFDDFIVNYVSSMPKKEYEEKYYANKLTLLTTWGDDVYYVN